MVCVGGLGRCSDGVDRLVRSQAGLPQPHRIANRGAAAADDNKAIHPYQTHDAFLVPFFLFHSCRFSKVS